jgi:hypothetical protein
MKNAVARPQSIDVVKRLTAPTTLAYELGAIAFATVATPLIFLGLKVMAR